MNLTIKAAGPDGKETRTPVKLTDKLNYNIADAQVKIIRGFSDKKSSNNFKKWFDEEFLKRFEFSR